MEPFCDARIHSEMVSNPRCTYAREEFLLQSLTVVQVDLSFLDAPSFGDNFGHFIMDNVPL